MMTDQAKLLGIPFPHRAHPSDVGMDVYAVSSRLVAPRRYMVNLGFHILVEEGWRVRICGKSGIARGWGIQILGGLIDPGYTGELIAIVHCPLEEAMGDMLEKHERVAQIEINPYASSTPKELDKAQFQLITKNYSRGNKGFGSTGS